MSQEEPEVIEFQNLGEYSQRVRATSDDFEKGEQMLYPGDGDLGAFWKAVDEALRSEFEDHLEEIRGEYDEILITEVVIDTGDLPVIKYVAVNEHE